jgi:hypothetical protein
MPIFGNCFFNSLNLINNFLLVHTANFEKNHESDVFLPIGQKLSLEFAQFSSEKCRHLSWFSFTNWSWGVGGASFGEVDI